MTELMSNDTGSFYYANNILYPKNFTQPLVNNTKVMNYKFSNKTANDIKKSVNKITAPKTKLILSNNKDPRKIHKKDHDHGHDHGHEHDHEHEHHEHHKYIHHEHGHKGCGHKHHKFHGHKHKGGHHKHKKVLYPMMIGLLTAKAIILPLVLKMLAFWSAKGLLLGLIATVMASILSLKKMIEPHYKIEGKKDQATKIELVSLPLHDRLHHHPKIYEYSAEGDESQHHPYGAYYQ